MNSSSSSDSIYQPIPISLQTSSNNESSDSSSSSSSGRSNNRSNQSQETEQQSSSDAKKTILNDDFSDSHVGDYKNIVCSLANESFSNVLQNCLIASLAFSRENADDARESDARESEQQGYEEDREEDGVLKTSIKKRKQDQRVRKRKRPNLNDSLHLGVWPIQENGSKLHSFASIAKDCKYHGERESMADVKVAETTCKQILLELRPKGRNRFFSTASATNKNDGDGNNVGNAKPIRTRNLGCVSVEDLWEAAVRVELSAAAIQNAKNRFHLLQFRNLLEHPSE